MQDYLETNKNSWEKAYVEGYGIKYPDSTLVTLYYRYMKPIILKNAAGKKANILDFGCGIGTNSLIFANDNMNCFGIDVSDSAIQKCKQNPAFVSQNFVALNLLKSDKNLEDIFRVKFDLIICPHVLYHFNNSDIARLINAFYDSLVDKGLFFANMVTFKHEAYRHLEKADASDGLYKVSKLGSVEEELEVNVVKGKEDVEAIFSRFAKIKCVKTIIECEEESESINFIGQKL